MRADINLLATPVFTWSAAVPLKAFLERWYCLAKFHDDGYTSLLNGKKAALIVTAGADEFDGADLVVEMYRRLIEFKHMESKGHLVVASVLSKEDVSENKVVKDKIETFVKGLFK